MCDVDEGARGRSDRRMGSRASFGCALRLLYSLELAWKQHTTRTSTRTIPKMRNCGGPRTKQRTTLWPFWLCLSGWWMCVWLGVWCWWCVWVCALRTNTCKCKSTVNDNKVFYRVFYGGSTELLSKTNDHEALMMPAVSQILIQGGWSIAVLQCEHETGEWNLEFLSSNSRITYSSTVSTSMSHLPCVLYPAKCPFKMNPLHISFIFIRLLRGLLRFFSSLNIFLLF